MRSGLTPAARRFAVGVLLAACSVLVATCRVDKLVSPPVEGVLLPALASLTDSAPKASTSLRATKIALGTSRPGRLSWRAERAHGSAWLGFVRPTGNAPDTLELQLNPAGLDTGTYLDTVVVSTNNSDAPPLRIPVAFDVHPCRVTAVPLDTIVAAPLNGTECGSPRAAGMFARLFGFAGTAGDSITLELQATGFDARLVLDTTALGGGTPLAQATACRGAMGDPCITYFRLPFTGDYVVEVNGATPAAVGTFVLNVAAPSAPQIPAGVAQFQSDSISPISIGALIAAQSVVFGATVSDADVVDTLRLEVELRRVGVTFTGTPTHTSGLVANGGTAKVVATVADDSSYHWRARVADQTGRRGPWTSFGNNVESVADFTTAVPQPPGAPAALAQLRGSDRTPITVGGANSTGSVVFRATVSDPDPGDQLRLEIELRPLGTPFTNAATAQTPAVASGTMAEVTVSGLSDNTGYHWQARVVDQTSRASAPWTTFGGNAETAADFVVAVPATQLVFTAQPTNTAAGAAITPAIQITALGADNNPALSFADTITLAIGTNPGSPAGVLSGILKVKAVAGVATFANLSINRTGTGYTLTATSPAVAGVTATSAAFNITPGPTTQLAFTAQPTNEAAGAAIAPAVQVTARDGQGNTAPAFTGNVTISIGTNPSGGTLSGTVTATAVAGIATFSNLRIDKVGTGYTLTAAATGLSGATSNAFNITPAAASVLVFTVQPSNSAAGAAISPAVQVTARDPQGNTATGFTGNVTVALGANPSSGTLGGTATVAAVAGVAAFATLNVNLVGTGYTLIATATGLTPDTSAGFDIGAAIASRLAFTVEPADVSAGATISPSIEVTVQDNLGNLVPTFTGTVTMALGANPGSGVLSGTASVAAVAGVATFGDLNINKTGAGYTLVASSAGLAGGTSAAFTVSPATPSKLAFTVQPTSTTAGANIAPAIQVTARDAFDNNVPAFTGNITVAIGTNPVGGTLFGTATVAAVSGVATFSGLSINRSGTGYTLSAAAAGLSPAASTSFAITAGVATQLVFTVQPSNAVAAATIAPAVQVTARDAQGNTATGFSGNVTVAIGTNPGGGTLGGSNLATPVGGVATFSNLNVNRTGTGYTLTAAAVGLTGVTATSTAFNITPGVATQLVFTAQPSDEPAGGSITPPVQVTARDAQGNTATGFTGNVTVAIGANPGAGTLSGTATAAAVAGVATFGNLSINKSGAGYTLTATATGLTGATSSGFTISAAPATLLVFTVQPSTVAAGAAIAPAVQVTAQDSLGNTATAFNSNVTVAIGNNPGGGAFLGTSTTTVTAVAGVATFSNLAITRVGTGYTLTASGAGAGTASSAAFNVTPGPATQLAFTVQPSNATANVANAPAVQVTARDAQGNTATAFTGVVTIAIGTNPGSGTLGGTPTAAAVAGMATFTNLRVNRTGTGYTFTATATGLAGATSATFNISPAPAVLLAFTTQPSADTAGEAITPSVVVTARDSVGNTATSFTGSVTVAIGTNPGGGTLSGTSTLPAVAGVATFTTISINRTGNGYTLTAAATGLTGATSAAFNIAPSTPTQLVVTVQPTNTVAGGVITPAVQITARDAQGNTATQYVGSVTVAIGANPGAATLSGTATRNAVAGVAAFNDLRVDKVGTGYTLTANDGGLTGSTTAAFNITAGGATQLAFTIEPVTTAAGAPISPTVQVTARDAQGNVAPSFTGNVTISLAVNPVGATLAGTTTIAAVAGVATFATLSIDTVATGYTFIAAASGLGAASSAAFNIVPAAASQLVFIVQPTTATAATTITPAMQVQARDAFGNTATAFTANVSMAIGANPGGGTLSGTATVAAVTGVATFSTLSINRSGTAYTLVASASGLTSATSATFNITPGAATQLAFTVQPSDAASAAAITPAVQVTARDAQGNTATSFVGSVTIAMGTNPSGGVLSGNAPVAAVAGVATFSGLNINLVGTGYTLTAAATGVTGATSATFNILPAGASVLVFTTQPASATAGVAVSPAVVVTARDAQGNTATGFTGNVTIAIGANPGTGTLTGTPTVAAVAGVATFSNLRINRTGTGYTLTAAATGATGATSAAFNITPAPATVLVFTGQPSAEVAGVAIAPAVVVTARDSVGNTATSFTGNITVAIGTNPGAGTLSGASSLAAVAGVATFADLRINRTGAGYTLTAAATGLTGATSSAFNISPAPASVLVFTVQPAGAAAGVAITPAVQVTARDSVGNTATTFTGTITVAIGTNPSGGALSGTAAVAAVAGVANFSGLSINLAGAGYTLTAAATGLTGGTSSAFAITSGTAATLFFTTQPSSATAGVANSPALVVTARDAQGNTSTGFTGNVTIAIGTNPGAGTLTGAPTVAAVAGVATFPNLRINRTGTGYTFTAAATGLTGATSAAFNISPAPAASLVFTSQPSDEVAGVAIAPPVQVTARDSVGNTATTFIGNVTVAIGTNPSAGTLSGNANVAAVAGIASFTDLAINRTGTGYTLAAAATGLTGTTSVAFNITPGTAATLAFTVQPSAVSAGAAIAPAVQVTARDNQGNTATAFTGNVTIAIGNNPAAGTLTGTPTVAAVAGVANFANLRINRTGTGYTLTAAATGPTGATSTAFNVSAAPANVLVFTVQPSAATAGVAISPAVQVTARDSVGNTATSFTSNVTIAIGTNPGGATLSGAAPVAAVAGVATFSNASLNRTGTGYTLTATAAGLTTGTSAAFNISPAPPSVLVVTTQPSTVTAGIAINPAMVVTARDSVGNTATSFTGNVTVAMGTNPGGGLLLNGGPIAAVAGVATFTNLRINRTGTGYTLTAAAPSLTGATSATFNVTPAPGSVLVFTVQPSDETAGVAISPAIQVTARDTLGNTATAFTGNVSLAINANPGSGTLTGGGAVAAVAGVATFAAASINRTGTGYTLNATATGVTTGTSATFNITPGAATQLAFTVQPSTTTAGATITPAVQVTARDNQGNTATSFTGSISVAIGTNPGAGTLTGTSAVAAVAGVASFATLSINNAAAGYTLTAAATGLTGATSATFTVSAGAANQLFFTAQPSTTTAGLAVAPAVVVTARDDQGNTATGFTGNVTVAIGTNPTGGAFRPTATTTVAAVAGIATFANLRIDRVGTGYTLTASAGGAGAASSAAFNITPGPASRVAFTGQPSTTTAGVAVAPAVLVAAQDSLGNTVPTFAGNVTLTLDVNPGGSTLLGNTATASGGVATFSNLRLNRTGAGYVLLASSAGLIASNSAAFNVVPAPGSVLLFTTQPSSATAGATISPAVVVTARDSVGNTATGFTGNVALAIGANPGGSTLGGTATLAATAGVATFSTLNLNRSGTAYTLTANAAGTTGATSAAFNITPGTASQLAFTVQPVATTAGTGITPAVQVTARDPQGNTATSFTGNITVAIGTNPSGGTLSGTATVAATAGVASFAGLSINLVGNGYTFGASSGALTAATSTAFNITPGTASALVFTVQPASATAGVAISPAVVVTARDAQGNTATGFVGNVTIAIGTNPGAGTLSGTATVAAASGVATFSGVSINRTGTGYTLGATATGPTGATSAAFNITPGTASVLVFTGQPSNTIAGDPITPAVVVTARDNQGNTATAFVGNVTVAIGTNPGAGTLSGTASVTAAAGVATFSTLSINRTGTAYTLTASATGPTGGTSAAFNITPGVAAALVFTTQPSNATAGAAISPAVVVTARDDQGNTATAFVGTVTVAIGTNPSGGALSGTAALAATAGVATFSGLSINLAGNGYTLTAAATGPTGTTSSAFNITPGAASVLVFTQQPTNTTAGTNITPTVQVTARDNQGNTATAFTANVTLAIGTNAGGGTLSGTAVQAAVAGVATFPGMSINLSGTGYTLTATATGPTAATSAAFNITPGTATVLAFTVQPSHATAGVSISPAVRVTARDNQGNTATAFTGSVSVAISANPGTGTLSGTASLAAVAGVATFSDLKINRTGTGYTLAASASGLTGTTSTAFNITPGTAAVLVFTTQPTNAVAGAAISPAVQVTARDDQGNTATAFTGTVTIGIGTNPGGGTLGGTTAVAATAGVASFSTLNINVASTGYTLTATATGPTAATSAAFNITPGTASVLIFTTPPISTTAGVAISPAVVVTARDNQGNTATTFTGTVTVAIGTNAGGGTLSGTAALAATAGVATFSGLSINAAGNGYTLTATATGPTAATSGAFNITPGTASVLIFTTQPNSATAGVAISPAVVVTARDNQGNTATAFTGTVTVAIGTNPSAGTLSGTASLAATAGVASFAGLSINAAGNGYTLTATATGPTGGTSTAFNITPGTASVLVFTTQPASATAGVAISPAVVVTARDNQGNTATAFTGTVTVAIGANPSAGTLSGTASIAATGGVASFAGLSINAAGNGYTFTATATGPTGATSSAFNITPGTASVLVFTTQPSSATAGVAISPAVVVTARDNQGNTATGFTGIVTVAIGTNPSAGTLSGTAAIAATAGVATFSGLSINLVGTGYTLTAAATGPTGATSTAFNITPGTASILVFTTQPSSEIAGAAISPAVVVTARDNQGNTATAFTGTVTVAIGTNPGGGTLSGTAAVAATAGVVTFSTLSINLVGTGYTLTATATGPTSATSTAFNITPGTASVLVFTTQPTSATAGVAISPAVVVTARDNQGNTATGFTGTVTVAIGTNPGSGTLSGTAAVAATAGVATFSTLSINLIGTGYTLTATATGPSAATSTAFNITPGTASVLVFTTQPTSATAGVAISPAVVVTARDNQGNTATGFTGTVTVAIGTNAGGGTLSGTAGVAATAGVATFSTLSINLVGTGYTLTASATGPTSATSTAFNITPGAASVLVFTSQPSSEIAGTAISPAVVVTARDNQGNTATAFTGTVTVAIGTNPGGGTLSGTAAIVATAGVATFSTLSINLVGTGYTLTATATGPSVATSTAFNITPGTASVLVFTTQPTNATAGVAISPAVVVTARDNQGNTATAFTGTVTVAIGTNPGSGTLSGTAGVAATAGVATFSGLSINLVGNGYTLSATATGPTSATSTAFNITPGTASVLVFTTQPSTEIAGTAINPAVVVTARDNQGNTATAFTGTVTVAIGTNPSGGTLSGTAALVATAGVATFSTLSINLVGTGYTLTASATGPTSATSTAFNITPGTASVLVFTTQPSTEIAGTAINPAVVVTARDNQGNTATAFTGTVTVAIGTNPSGGTLSGTAGIAATAGVATFSTLSINLVGTGYTLTATATGPSTATSAAFNITPGTASVLVFTAQPTTATAGVAISPAVVVTARDNQGNTATGFTGTVTVAIGTNPSGGTLSGTAALAATAGVATFSTLSINLVGTGYTLTATATGPSAATSTAFNITAGTASVLVFTTQPTSATAGVAISPAVVVTARDNQGNTATGFTGTVTVAIGTNPGGGTLSGTAALAATAGVASFSGLSINLVGNGYTLGATATGPSAATSTAFNITPGTASVLVFTAQPTTATAGVAISPAIVVTARDIQGNTATGFTGTVTVAIGTNPAGGTLSGTAGVAATAGVATFSTLSINLVGTGYTLTAAATGPTGATSTAFNITPGTASVLVFTAQPTTATAGVAISPAVVVTARDNQGNTATAFTGTVTIAIGNNAGASTLSGTAAIGATAGVATFSTLSLNHSGTGYTLTAAATGPTGATSGAFNINPGTASVLVFTTQPNSATAGVAISPAVVVTARDNQGNTATGFTSTVTIAIGTNPSGGTLSGTAALAATAGVATFSGLSINVVGNGYTLGATATGPTAATSTAFNITPGTASVLVFTTQPTSATGGVAISPAVVVTARDNQGNTATGFTGTVTVAIGTNPGGGTLSGTAGIAATAGVATFSTLSINLVGNGYTLTATATGPTSATSSAFNITAGTASVLVFTQQPTNTTAGSNITPTIQVTARDNQGNTATAFTGNVTLAIGTNAGGGTLSGTATQAAAAGVVAFPGMSINLAGNGYTLTATATGPTSAISAAFNITPGAASVLVFTTQPTSATAGVAISPAVVVTARDNQGNTATAFTGTVTVAIGTNPSGGALSGTAAIAATAGVATFSGLSINLVGTGYTLTANATGPTGATSTAFSITPGTASVLVFTTQPTSATAGVAITPSVVVTARDNQGNTATGFTGNVTVAIGNNPSAGTLSGTATQAAVAGVASFLGLSINAAGTGYTLTAAATGTTGATSAAFNITPGTASVLVFTTQPTSATAGVAISPAVVVTARDNQGNTATSFTGTVTVAIGTNPSGGTLSGTAALAATAGVASFSGLSINLVGTGYTLTATATGPSAATSSAFNITPGTASILVFTTQPTSATAGVAISPAAVVTARDNQGNTATGFTGTVTIAIGTNAGGGTLSGTAGIAATAGLASFSGLSINLVGTGYTLTATATGPTSATSTAFNITPGTANILVFTTQPASATAGVTISPAVVVTARDNQGNTATGFTGTVTVAIASNPGASTLSGTAAIAATAGVATFSGLSLNHTGTGYTLSATATGPSAGTSSAFNITPGTASILVFTTQPTNAVAGVGISPAVVVTARDNQGNTATSFVANITVAIGTNPGGGTLSGTNVVAATGGVASFPGLSINLIGAGYTFSATAGGVTGATSTTFTITAATPATIVVNAGNGQTDTVGQALPTPPSVLVRDAFGNPVGLVSVTFTVTGGGGAISPASPATVATAATGIATLTSWTLGNTAGPNTLTAASGTLIGSPVAFTGTGVAGVVSASLSSVSATGVITASTGSSQSTITVTVRDQFSNLISGATVTFAATGSSNTLTPSAMTNGSGVAAGALSSTLAEAKTVSASANGTPITQSSAVFVQAGPASAAQSLVSAAPGSIVASSGGTTSTITVTVRDQFNNPIQFANVAVSSSGTGHTITGPGSTTNSAGVATATLSSMLAQIKTVTGTVNPGASQVVITQTAAVTVNPAAAASIAVNAGNGQSATVNTAVAVAPSVVVRDAFNNLVSGVSVTFTVTGGGGTISPVSPAIVATVNGVAALTSWTLGTTAGANTLSASSGSLTGSPVAFTATGTAGTATQIVFTTEPTGGTTITPITPAIVLTLRDAFGNTATGFVGTVTMTIEIDGSLAPPAALTPTTPVAVVNGTATFSDLVIDKVGTGYTLRATAGSLFAISAAFTIL